MRLGRALAVYATAIVMAAEAASAAQPQTIEDLGRLSIEELSNLEITSVSKRPEPLSRAPAAVYVITSEDIRRSGAVSLPEVLRLAPNLEVARVNATSYAISARGFNSFEAANKLLVLIDGRSVYTPLHAGVFWDQQQVPLDDIERIEVISGPGGTLWGANAVNGVINIITRNSADTQGGLANLRGGTDSSGTARYGGKIGENGSYRVYGMGFTRNHSFTPDGRSADDDWDGKQGGFRSDFHSADDAFTLQGDLFDNSFDDGGTISGGNLLGRWNRQLGNGSALELQAYYDKVDRRAPGVTDSLETFDFQAQQSLQFGERHQVVWGGGHRITKDDFINTLNFFVLDPAHDTVQLSNIFAQDSIALREDLTLTLGTKFEYSSLSGFDYLPNVRLGWQVSDRAFVWGAVSRAVRTPSRIDRNLVGPGVLQRATDFQSEKLIAYEVGVRGQPSAQTSLSVSFFYNDYDDLRALTISPSGGQLVFGNAMKGYTYGVETWGDYRVLSWWRLSAGLTVLQKRLELEPGAIATAIDQHAGNDPDYQFSLRSSMDVAEHVELDVGLRRIDELPNPAVPGYTEADARIGWHVTNALELSLAGFNLFDNYHPETGAAATRRELGRTVYAGARWRF